MIVFDDMIADLLRNKKVNTIAAELFIRGKKLDISFVFIIHIILFYYYIIIIYISFFNFRLKLLDYFIMKIANKREVQQIVFNHSSDIDFKDFTNLYKKGTFFSFFNYSCYSCMR